MLFHTPPSSPIASHNNLLLPPMTSKTPPLEVSRSVGKMGEREASPLTDEESGKDGPLGLEEGVWKVSCQSEE
jgi:hypothetical protein